MTTPPSKPRKKQIEEAAINGAYGTMRNCFALGAQWADANPIRTEAGEAGDEAEAEAYAASIHSEGWSWRKLGFLAGRKGMVPDWKTQAGVYLSHRDHVRLVAEAVKAAAPELARIKFYADQYIQAYAPDFFNEPDGFTPKLDMNSAALVRRTLLKILNPRSGE